MARSPSIHATPASGWITLGVLFLSVVVLYVLGKERSKANVPVVGSNVLGGWSTALRATVRLPTYLKEGYEKYRNSAFQVPNLAGWVVYVQGQAAEEVAKLPEEVLSYEEEADYVHELRHILPSPSAYGKKKDWHLAALRSYLSPSGLSDLFPGMLEEVRVGYEKELALPEGEDWKDVIAWEPILRTTCRALTRLFVGTTLSGKSGYLEISRDFSTTLTNSGNIVSFLPGPIKGWVSEWLLPAPDAIKAFLPFTEALVGVRERLKEKLGAEEWERRKPSDLLQVFMESPDGPGLDPEKLNKTLLRLNHDSIHPTAMMMAHAFYQLAANPSYAQELREEVDACTTQGWTLETIGRMRKLDSFLKESMRITPVFLATGGRRAVKPARLSDGAELPKGAHVYVNAWGIQHDSSIWPEADTFQPWRFVKTGDKAEASISSAETEPGVYVWGTGSHLCPGRQFASLLVRLQLAHLVSSYDIMLREGEQKPGETFWGMECVPHMKVQVSFRRRNQAQIAAA